MRVAVTEAAMPHAKWFVAKRPAPAASSRLYSEARRTAMIPIPQPALALNTSEFGPEYHYTMQASETVTRYARVEFIVESVLRHAGEQGGRLEALVINAHGMAGPDGVALGVGLHFGNAHLWGPAHGLVGRIWLCACQVADTRAGRDFCQALAAATGAEVVGTVEPQVATYRDLEPTFGIFPLRLARIPPDCVDEFEGPIFLWSPDGAMRPFDPHG